MYTSFFLLNINLIIIYWILSLYIEIKHLIHDIDNFINYFDIKWKTYCKISNTAETWFQTNSLLKLLQYNANIFTVLKLLDS